MSISAVRNAIATWVLAGSRLSADRIFWAPQKAPRPPKPYVELRITRVSAPHADWRQHRDAASPAPGREIEHLVRGPRVATLTLRCFASEDGVGDASPDEILENIKMSLGLPSVYESLQTAGVGVGRWEDVQSIDGIFNSTILEPRSSTSVSLHLAREMSEFGTYIETYELEPTYL